MPSWENLTRRGLIGPGWCALYRNEEESTSHLFLSCPYCVEVWKEVCMCLKLNKWYRWEGVSILQAWENWRRLGSSDILNALPLMVTWGIWLARNKMIFKGKECTPAITAGLVCGQVTTLPTRLMIKKQREVLDVAIDRSTPWGYFDGAAQNNICGGGVVLYVNENHYFEMSVGLGAGSNNRAELLSLQLILIFAAKKGCRSLQIFGDSLNVINWVKKIQTCSDLILRNILLTIWEMVETFDLITFTHVYRENNC